MYEPEALILGEDWQRSPDARIGDVGRDSSALDPIGGVP
jgi:hypothetical protein